MVWNQLLANQRDPELNANKKLWEDGKATRVITGYKKVRIGPDGSTNRPVYDYIPNERAAAASTPEEAPPPKRSTGEYDDVVGSLKLDQAAGLAEVDKLKAQQAQLKKDQAKALQESTASLTASFNKQIADLNTANAATIDKLTSKYDEQASQFADYQTLMSGQLATAQANYEEQAQMVRNMESAYVPAANPNAVAAAIGDQRVDNNRPLKSNRLSDLSSLSIVSGLGTASNPLSGLQLA
jgi:hypothetical protein